MHEEITLSPGETKTVDGLTVAHAGGGHKILADEFGRRAGDLSFGVIEMNAPGVPSEKTQVFSPKHEHGREENPIEFGPYLITVVDVGWNGTPIKLLIKRSESLK